MKLSEEEMGRFQGLIDGLVDFGVTAGILESYHGSCGAPHACHAAA